MSFATRASGSSADETASTLNLEAKSTAGVMGWMRGGARRDRELDLGAGDGVTKIGGTFNGAVRVQPIITKVHNASEASGEPTRPRSRVLVQPRHVHTALNKSKAASGRGRANKAHLLNASRVLGTVTAASNFPPTFGGRRTAWKRCPTPRAGALARDECLRERKHVHAAVVAENRRSSGKGGGLRTMSCAGESGGKTLLVCGARQRKRKGYPDLGFGDRIF